MGVTEHTEAALRRLASGPPHRWIARMARDAELLSAYFRKEGRHDCADRWAHLAEKFRATAIRLRPC
jgi:hypothetical protein